jgi:hypothetical protein
MYLGLVSFAIAAAIAVIVEYRMLPRAVARRVGGPDAGRRLNPIAVSWAFAPPDTLGR